MKKTLGVVALVAMVVVAGGLWIALYADYSDGYRVGRIIKLSRRGYVFKTWEGTLDFGYLQTDPQAGVATRIWDFSVPADGEDVRKDIDAAIAGDYKTKLFYREKYIQLPWRGETKYFVYKVERAS
jgi:hypothetical protein